MASKQKKPSFPGHKCAGAKLYVAVHCECGWSSGKWGATGGRSSAYHEWHYHVEQCQKAQDVAAKAGA